MKKPANCFLPPVQNEEKNVFRLAETRLPGVGNFLLSRIRTEHAGVRRGTTWHKNETLGKFSFSAERRRLGCGLLRHTNGDERAMSKWSLWETSPVRAWKYFKSERSEKQNFYGSGKTV